jgi:hypothetical protein
VAEDTTSGILKKTLNQIVPEQSDFLTKTIDMSLPDPGPNTVNMKTSTELICSIDSLKLPKIA